MNGLDVRSSLAAALATLLGSAAFVPVFLTSDWFPPVLATVVVVLAGGLLLRAGGRAVWSLAADGRPVPAALETVGIPLVPLAQLALVGWLLTALYAPGTASGGILPSASGIRRVGAVLRDGAAELQEQSTPALPLHGLLALTVILVGLVAVAVDLLTVAGRQAGLAGLGLLVLFCVPVSTVMGGIGVPALAGPAAGLVVLLWTDQQRRLRRSGRVLERRPGAGSARALRIGLLALVVGLVVGGVVPTFAEGALGGHGGAGDGTGPGSSTGRSLDPVALLHGQLTLPQPINLLRVHTSVDDPGYLRAVALETYDPERGWVLGSLNGEQGVAGVTDLVSLPPRETSRPVTDTIEAIGHDDRFLPLPYAPQTVRVRGADPLTWRFDPGTSTVFARDASTRGRTYTVTAREPRPSIAQLERAPEVTPDTLSLFRDTQLPPLDPGIRSLVDSLVRGATTPYDRVAAIDRYFIDPANGFVYSLSTKPGTSRDDLVNFLTGKQGYCEQYAGAMAVLVRAAGVPARVVLGYTPGTVRPDGTRLITSSDAHAWVEAYFAGLGWVPFDPTPASASRAQPLAWAPRVTTDDGTGAQPTAPGATGPAPAAGTARLERETQFLPVRTTQQSAAGWLRPALLGLAGLVVAGLLGAVPALLRARQRRRRLADGSAGALWDELAATARDAGLRWPAARTTRQTALAFARLIDGGGAARGSAAAAGGSRRPDTAAAAIDAVRRLALAEEAASYARPDVATGGDPAAAAPLRTALATARRGLLRSVARRARLRAVLWPSSLVGMPRAERLRGWTGRRRGLRAGRRSRPV